MRNVRVGSPAPLLLATLALTAACARPAPIAPAAPATALPRAAPSAAPPIASSPPAPPAPAPRGEPAPEPNREETPCPAGMIHVDTSYCPEVERTCRDSEYDKPNHLRICHAFERRTRCLAKEERRDFCIDAYEYPNEKGAHPPWMVSWYDAEATCQAAGKRLCYASEWTAACEGPEKTPFPYGWSRDHDACNIDNAWIDPRLGDLYAKNPEVAARELARLDQSVPSGAMDRCVSGFGVHDLTGNFDEWVTSDEPAREKSLWAGLKGGGWGHVRQACRPMTTSHPPDFTYYFIAFRCCADARGAEPWRPRASTPRPAQKPAVRAPLPRPEGAPGPSKTKVGRARPKPAR